MLTYLSMFFSFPSQVRKMRSISMDICQVSGLTLFFWASLLGLKLGRPQTPVHALCIGFHQ